MSDNGDRIGIVDHKGKFAQIGRGDDIPSAIKSAAGHHTRTGKHARLAVRHGDGSVTVAPGGVSGAVNSPKVGRGPRYVGGVVRSGDAASNSARRVGGPG